jgi:hypothetical protein
LWVLKKVYTDTKETQEVPGAEKELDKDAVSRLFSSTYTTRTFPTKILGRFGNFKIEGKEMQMTF